VGQKGQLAMKGPWTLEKCILEFENKVYQKSEEGNYRILEMNY